MGTSAKRPLPLRFGVEVWTEHVQIIRLGHVPKSFESSKPTSSLLDISAPFVSLVPKRLTAAKSQPKGFHSVADCCPQHRGLGQRNGESWRKQPVGPKIMIKNNDQLKNSILVIVILVIQPKKIVGPTNNAGQP